MKESIRGLNRIDRELGKYVVRRLREVAKNPVAVEARRRWSQQRIKPSQAARAVKWSGTSKGAGITLKYGTLPYAAGVEFGAKQYAQFRPWRGNRFTTTGSTGYVVQDAIRDTLPSITSELLDSVIKTMDRLVENG